MKAREFWVLFLPSLVVMAGLLVVPLIRTIQWSFEDVHYGTPGSFVGLDNFAAALTDARFGSAVLFTVTVTIITTIILLVLGYLVATGMNRLTVSRPLVLGIMLVSYVLPNLVGAVAYSWLFDDNFGGVVNHLIGFFGGSEVLWFTDKVPNAILVISNTVWHMLPFAMLIILAGLQGVPVELREAATIDGANAFQTHLSVIIPTIRGVLGFVTLITIMDVLRMFDNLIPLTAGRRDRQRVDHALRLFGGVRGRRGEAGPRQRDQRAHHSHHPRHAHSVHPGIFKEARLAR